MASREGLLGLIREAARYGGCATLTIAPGAARFAMSATALGESRVRFATNATPIVLTKEPQGWHSAAFSIADPYHAEPWSLVIAPAQWKE